MTRSREFLSSLKKMTCDGLCEEAEAVDDFLSGDKEVIDVCLLVKNDAAVKVEGVWFCGGRDT